jgi:O-antigen/teichoic acid export membrane protein
MTITQTASGSLDRSLARAVAWNAAARWVSQILSWGSTIIVARLLRPYDYGIVGMAGLYLNLAMYVSQSGIGDAVIALRDLTRRQIAELNTLALVVGVGLVGLTCALARPIALFFSSPPLYKILLVSSAVYIFNAFQVVPRALLQKELRFKLIAGIETVRTFFQVMVTIVFALRHFGYWSLVLGYTSSSLAVSLFTLYWKRHEFAKPAIRLLGRELTFSRQAIISRIAWYSYENADFGVAGRILGPIPLGNYTVAWNISSAPLEKIANLVTGVTPAYFSAMQTEKSELKRYLLRITEILSLVTVPASIGLALVAQYLVPALLGPNWSGAIGPLRLLGAFVAVRSITTFLPNLLTAIGDVAFVMWTTIASAIIMPIAFYIGSKSRWETTGIAAAWLVVYPIIITPICYRIFQKTGITVIEYVATLVPAVVGATIMALVVAGIRLFLPWEWPAYAGLLVLVISGAVAYSLAMYLLYGKRLTHLLKTAKGMLGKTDKL